MKVMLVVTVLFSIGIFISLLIHGRYIFHRSMIGHMSQQNADLFSRNIITGYSSLDSALYLAENNLVGGFFLSGRNIKGRSKKEISNEIRLLQRVRRKKGLEPLIICVDQEGGPVSRLSPPLKYYETAGFIAASQKNKIEEKKAVKNYSFLKASDLKNIGITMNFSPVVDLKSNNEVNNFDLFTQVSKRAISKNKLAVARVALSYCKEHMRAGVIPVLKHFPGIGNINVDTHFFTAEIEKYSYDALFPFIEIGRKNTAAIMLSHTRILSVDKDEIVSCSKKHVDYIRQKISSEVLLITDDFSMGPVYYSLDGPWGKAIKALRNGVDFILLSYDDALVYSVIYELNKAVKYDKILVKALLQSRKRIEAGKKAIKGKAI